MPPTEHTAAIKPVANLTGIAAAGADEKSA